MNNVADTQLYDTLGVSPGANVDEIKKSFRKLALKWHPDKWAKASEAEKLKAEETFKNLSEAYGILCDPQKREIYDQVGLEGMKNNGYSHSHDMSEEIREMFKHMGMGGMGGFSGMGGMGGMGGFMPFEMNRQAQSAKPSMPKLVHTLVLSLQEIYTGASLEFEVDRYVLKKEKQPKEEDFICKACKGMGRTTITRQIGPGMLQQSEQGCKKCNQEGVIIPEEFFEKKRHKFSRTIPQGIIGGEKIVIENKGHEVPECFKGKNNGNDRTDVVLIITENKECEVSTDEQTTLKYIRGVNKNPFNLAVELEINSLEAICGATRYLPFINGVHFTVNISPGVIFKKGNNMNNVVVVPKKGMPYYKQKNTFGDLYVILNIKDDLNLDDNKIRQIYKICSGREMKRDVEKVLKKCKDPCHQSMTLETFNKSEDSSNSTKNYHAFVRSMQEKANSRHGNRHNRGNGHNYDDDTSDDTGASDNAHEGFSGCRTQ